MRALKTTGDVDAQGPVTGLFGRPSWGANADASLRCFLLSSSRGEGVQMLGKTPIHSEMTEIWSSSASRTSFYVAVASGSLAAYYQYDPYGNVIAASGVLAAENPWRFSTKYFEAGTGLGYWGYRWYAPGMGRWLSRDPIGEEGGVNLSSFILNSPPNYWDPDGRAIPSIVSGLAAAAAVVIWQGLCAQWALDRCSAVAFPADPNQYKTHCCVGCLNTRCSAGIPLSSIAGQLLHEATIAWRVHDGRFWEYDWDEILTDTKAAMQGILYSYRFSAQGCIDACWCYRP